MNANTSGTPGRCWDCGGPCMTYKGSVHGWRCRRCIDYYLNAGATRFAATDAKDRDKRLAKVRTDMDAVSRRGGGGSGFGPHRHHDIPEPAGAVSR